MISWGGAGSLNKVTQPTLWKGGTQILEDVRDDEDSSKKSAGEECVKQASTG